MEKIKLANGLIALGGEKGFGKTRFALKYANYLAQKEKVLYVSYQNYKEKLESIVEEMDGVINENLGINSYFSYYGAIVFFQFMKEIKSNNVSTLIIDDIENFCQLARDNDYGEENNPILSLKYLSEFMNIKVVFITNIEKLDYQSETIPKIQDFRWSRSIINECDQIYALYRPYLQGLWEDEEGNSLKDKIEILYLKNEYNKEDRYIYNNKYLNIYNHQY